MPSSRAPGTATAQRRLLISRVATSLFLERGFDAVSIAQIADAAGVSKMTVTNHFPLKEDLVFDEFANELELLVKALADVTSVPAAVDAIERYCAAQEHRGPMARALATGDLPSRVREFAEMVSQSRALTSRFHMHYQDVRETIETALPSALRGMRREVVAWMLAETVHLVEWWPVQAVIDEVPPARIQTQRVRVRREAFAVLRSGLLAD